MRRKPTTYDLPDGEGSLTATKLRRSDRETQIDVMRNWFFANFADPAENTPYESAEGGYIYIWGGPYEPAEELHDEFGGLIRDDVIDELADELRGIAWEWTKHPDYGDVDDYLFESISRTTEHQKAFEESVENVESLIRLGAGLAEQKQLLRLLYVNVITVIETYLSDLFISAVGNDKALLRRFVETTPEFKSEKVSYSEVFKAYDEIEKKARSYLMDVVWHHLGRVKPMFSKTLGVEFPSDMGDLFKAVLVRHDLVHRNGKMKEGGEHDITPETVRALIKQAREFIAHVDSHWTGKEEI